jgi:predicted  nucleic acid-binding Zn-ribbon protein
MQWECDRCETVHTQNPSECRSCGNRAFRPVSDEQTTASAREDQAALDAGDVDTYGTTSTEPFDSGPDVAADGSLERESEVADAPGNDDSAGNAVLRTFWYKLRGTLIAATGLLRELLIPLLAVVAVVLLVAWLLA